MKCKYIYVMDYSIGAIFVINVEEDYPDGIEYIDIIDILKDYGIDIDNCCYMYSDSELEVETIEKIK